MSFIRNKVINGKKYAYEITAYWDHESKSAKQKSKYLGIVDEQNNIIKKVNKPSIEHLILDFGNGYLLDQFMQTSILQPILMEVFPEIYTELKLLIFYKVCMQSAMYNCKHWLDGNILNKFNSNADLSSQNISRILYIISNEAVQRQFFIKYLSLIGNGKKNLIIDATSLPNQISSGFNAWGHADGCIEKQFRLLCVVEQENKMPLFYRYLPGNITDVSTLVQTIAELTKLGIKNSYVLIDAGYFSRENICALYDNKIDFLVRLPSSRNIYKELLQKCKITELEQLKHGIKYGHRGLFVKKEIIDLYGNTAFAYLVLDPARKGKEINKFLVQYFNDTDRLAKKYTDEDEFNSCGIMILISSRDIDTTAVVSCYYVRQTVEQIFGYCKDDLSILPIRKHNDDTIRGYLFLQFLSLIFFIQLREKLSAYTVEQALLLLRNLKCKIFEKEIIISELTKQTKLIFKDFNIIVPKSLGI